MRQQYLSGHKKNESGIEIGVCVCVCVIEIFNLSRNFLILEFYYLCYSTVSRELKGVFEKKTCFFYPLIFYVFLFISYFDSLFFLITVNQTYWVCGLPMQLNLKLIFVLSGSRGSRVLIFPGVLDISRGFRSQ